MARAKPGLHKEISAIFGGVPIPKDDGSTQATEKHVPGRVGYVPLRPEDSRAEPAVGPESREAARPPGKPPSDRRDFVEDMGRVGRRRSRPRVKQKLFVPRSGVSPARQKATTVIFLVLLAAFVLLVLRPFVTPSRDAARPQRRNPVESGGVIGSDIEIDWEVPPVYTAGLRDPMKYDPVSISRAEAAAATQPVVRGIVCSEDEQYAIVGTQIVKEGETVLGAEVVKVREDGVEFEKDGERWVQEVEAETDDE
ncbi:MAG: hypothetical protein ACYTEQ_07085 [Planctomycetota bacterium]|jgi:hypothetical protein